MFEYLFDKPHIIARHRNAPYREQREVLLKGFHQQGYSRGTLRRTARELLWLAQHYRVPRRTKVTIEQLRAVMHRWARRMSKSCRTHSPRWAKFSFLLTAVRLIRSLGRLKNEVLETPKFIRYLDEFAQWMSEERGLSPLSIHLRRRCLTTFLEWCEKNELSLGSVRAQDIDHYFSINGTRRWSRQTTAIHVNSLRVFFRYAETRRWCKPSIARAIISPRIYSHEALPSGPSWSDVRRLFAETKTDRPSDIRTHALLILFAVYGLRSSEVSHLRLEDIDWEHDRIKVWRPKRREFQTYPLIPTLGNSIIRYLREVRPSSSCREVFLTLRPPFRPASIYSHACMLSRLMRKCGIQSRHNGPHSLRHACATRLVERGLSLKEIGDHLGHRSPDSTRIYAKVNLPALRTVADFNIGGVI